MQLEGSFSDWRPVARMCATGINAGFTVVLCFVIDLGESVGGIVSLRKSETLVIYWTVKKIIEY